MAALFFLFTGLLAPAAIIIDHNCTDISKIPDAWITKVKSMLRIHYAHTSHGEQITVGLERLANSNSKYNFYPDNCNVPDDDNYLCLMDGQYFDSYCETYVTPELYWQGTSALNITRGVLNTHDVNISLWAWCTQLDYFSQSEAQQYLDNMAKLEQEYPDITFIYMTGNCQSNEQNRHSRNTQIRQYVQNHNKILLDFGDLDCWYNGQQHTENGIPMENPHYNGDEAGHTTYSSCENKAKASWWLLARIAGWDGTSSTAKPTITLSKNQANFGFVLGGSTPASQTVNISNTGSGTLHWSASEISPWLGITPTSGTDSGTLTLSINTTGLMAGTYTGTITITDSNATNSPQTVSVNFSVYSQGSDSPPFGSFDTPLNNSAVTSSIPVTGWVLDDTGVNSVKIYREGDGGTPVYIGDAVFVDGARPDVEAAYPAYPNNTKAGWGYMLLTNFLPNKGNGTFTIYAVATDTGGRTTNLGSSTIICDNAHAVKPFGAIDTPTQGGTVSGSSYVNWGWVLTPQPNSINTNGSKINVYVDGMNMGHPTYNLYRSDIATFFPGYANSNGAVGYYYLNTTAFDNGVHTIGWIAEDSGGNADGIGSRFFSINNPSSQGAGTPSIHNRQRDGVHFPGNTHVKSLPYTNGEPMIAEGSIGVKTGFNENTRSREMRRDGNGIYHVEINALGRVEIRLGKAADMRYTGYLLVGDQRRPLPIGSTMDRQNGVFYWQPGPGFLGTYEMLFVPIGSDEGNGGIKVGVTIVPEGK